jgi:S-adenosylmethionine:tRNA ribosyltransferase-isomerase
MTKFQSVLDRYNYDFPRELIAQEPASPRDAARLLVYNRATGTKQFDTYANLAKYLPPRSVLVFNQTKVIPARLRLTKPTSGKVSILYFSHGKNLIEALADRRLAINSKLRLNRSIFFTVKKQETGQYFLKPSFPMSRLLKILSRHGEAPVPPYIKHSALSRAQLKEKYQTVFAKIDGSVAAPTASLHFTRRLLKNLKAAGHEIHFVTLHVGLGTFAPLTSEQIKNKALHFEHYDIPPKTAAALNRAKKQGRPIIAVGTTVVRTLESAANARGELKKLSAQTDLFISPGYRFKFVDNLITNFHVPRSSLLMLAAAFIGRKQLLALYKTAISKKFRLFSFGDGMLIRR